MKYPLKSLPTSLLVLLILSMQSNVAKSAQDNALPLDCTAIPSVDDQLCYVTTDSPLGPYDDVVFFRKTSQLELFLLGSKKGGVAGFGGVGFSKSGKYMWLEWTEEGHPSFSFYSTERFLIDGLAALAIDTLAAYSFEKFVSFSDDGMVLYTKEHDEIGACKKTPCMHTINLNKQKPVNAKNQPSYTCTPIESIGYFYQEGKWVVAINDISDNTFRIKAIGKAEVNTDNNPTLSFGIFDEDEQQTMNRCIKDKNIVCINGLNKLIFSPTTGRYIQNNMAGYWNGEDNANHFPSMTIGRCEAG